MREIKIMVTISSKREMYVRDIEKIRELFYEIAEEVKAIEFNRKLKFRYDMLIVPDEFCREEGK